ncbi:MAG: hypothetical protein P4L40_15470 [Terracidiphilus sp.]|nr:hypothetical protein [Terracidiphilus sp.]
MCVCVSECVPLRVYVCVCVHVHVCEHVCVSCPLPMHLQALEEEPEDVRFLVAAGDLHLTVHSVASGEALYEAALSQGRTRTHSKAQDAMKKSVQVCGAHSYHTHTHTYARIHQRARRHCSVPYANGSCLEV